VTFATRLSFLFGEHARGTIDRNAAKNRTKQQHLEIFCAEIRQRANARVRSNARNVKIHRHVPVFTTLSHHANNARVSTSCASGEMHASSGREGILDSQSQWLGRAPVFSILDWWKTAAP
jgi:hypothetical protein